MNMPMHVNMTMHMKMTICMHTTHTHTYMEKVVASVACDARNSVESALFTTKFMFMVVSDGHIHAHA